MLGEKPATGILACNPHGSVWSLLTQPWCQGLLPWVQGAALQGPTLPLNCKTPHLLSLTLSLPSLWSALKTPLATQSNCIADLDWT